MVDLDVLLLGIERLPVGGHPGGEIELADVAGTELTLAVDDRLDG